LSLNRRVRDQEAAGQETLALFVLFEAVGMTASVAPIEQQNKYLLIS
jgi:hypothetical protein